MSVTRSLAAWLVIVIAALTVVIEITLHHQLGSTVFTATAFLALAIVILFDLSTIPRRNSPFSQCLTSAEFRSFRVNHIALLYPGAAHFYSGLITAFSMCGAVWAATEFIERHYVTGALLVVHYFVTAFENIRLNPKEHIAKSAAVGNILAIERQHHWESIRSKMKTFSENGPLASG